MTRRAHPARPSPAQVPPEAVLEAAREIGRLPGYSPPEGVLVRALSHPYVAALLALGFTWEPRRVERCGGCKAWKPVSQGESPKGERYYEIRCSRCGTVAEREWPNWMWWGEPRAPAHLQPLAVPLACVLAKAGGQHFWRDQDFGERFFMVWGADSFLRAADDMAAGREPTE